jgi:hypothetical protein
VIALGQKDTFPGGGGGGGGGVDKMWHSARALHSFLNRNQVLKRAYGGRGGGLLSSHTTMREEEELPEGVERTNIKLKCG